MSNQGDTPQTAVKALFRPFDIKNLALRNRIVMAPMTRSFAPQGVPGPDVAAYYRRRAEGGVGLIVTEGVWIPHPAAGFNPRVPQMCGATAGAGWRQVVDAVHRAGGRIIPQLWHVGAFLQPHESPAPGIKPIGPSGLAKPGVQLSGPMSQAEIDAVIEAFAAAAEAAKHIGFDGLELHGAHGYLLDQFFWEGTNRRTDRYGGGLVQRTRFAVEVLEAIRARVGSEFPIFFRYSQWKQQDYAAKLVRSPTELERFLEPLVEAGVDVFDCSTRRFWEPEFEGSNLNLAGWTKKLTGKPTITVGSITLETDLQGAFGVPQVGTTDIDELLARLNREEFDLVALGRALIVNPSWPALIARGEVKALLPFRRDALAELS